METFTLKGIITSTSDKQDKDFTGTPQKSIYLELDEQNTLIAEGMGMKKYTDKKDGNEFFVTKISKKLSLYKDAVFVEKISGIAEEHANFNSGEDAEENGLVVEVAISKGFSEKHKTTYFRVYAINGDIVEVQGENPFI